MSYVLICGVLTCLVMLLDSAACLALLLRLLLGRCGQRAWLDWHAQRGFSVLQLGLRELQRLRLAVTAIKGTTTGSDSSGLRVSAQTRPVGLSN